ncbi:MAG: hypothetical protein PUA82_06085 [Eubacteriales bacterium]|nr:hypothetical protein [Eubacteriales bacterium]
MKNRSFMKLKSRRNAAYIQSLIDGIRANDSNALAALYSLTVTQLYHDLYMQIRNTYEVQDCIAEFYIRFCHTIGDSETPIQAAMLLCSLEDDILSRYTAVSGGIREDIKPRPELSDTESDIILSDLLNRLRMPENSIPLELINEYDVYIKRKSKALRWIIAGAAALLIIIPLLFLNPAADISETGRLSPFTGRPAYALVVDNILPVESVTAEINGNPVSIMQESRSRYTLLPQERGMMTVTVRTVGLGSASRQIDVE